MAYSVPIGYFDEGQQADEYRERKRQEHIKELENEERRYGHDGTRNQHGLMNNKRHDPNAPITKRDLDEDRAGNAAQRAKGSNPSGSSYSHGQNRNQYEKDYDAGRKHYRRTHKESASIFDEISIM